jgi:cytochrome c
MKTRGFALVAAGLLVLSAHTLAEEASGGDPAAGERVYKKCMTCHRIGPGATNVIGPQQNNLVGRPAGEAPGFAYSPLNKAAGAAGLVWTEANLFDYLADPNEFLRKFLKEKGKAELATGVTKMAFKLPSATERKDVIAYLKKFKDVK